jgi:GNAT superfamily N-acetyltransferase
MRDYFDSSPHAQIQQYDAEYFLNNVRKNIISPTSEVAVAEWDNKTVGFSLSYLGDYLWTHGLRVNMELIHVMPEYPQNELTQGLLDHNIAWARSQGAVEFFAGDIGMNIETVTRFYQMQGFADPGVVIRRIL